MENGSTNNSSNSKILVGILWIASLLATAFIGFTFGQKEKLTVKPAPQNVLTSLNQVGDTPIPTQQITPSIIPNTVCAKSGFAQKWEYLTSYTVKEGDSLQDIVTTELNDSTRLNEVLQINGVGPLVVGSTLYLPPKLITKSAGKLKQIYGRLVVKDKDSWQLSFNGEKDGQRIIIPTFWFEEIADKESFIVGECLTVLLDDGFKVFSVAKQ